MKIRPDGVGFFYAGERTDRQTNIEAGRSYLSLFATLLKIPKHNRRLRSSNEDLIKNIFVKKFLARRRHAA
jgi:hypothetical protein